MAVNSGYVHGEDLWHLDILRKLKQERKPYELVQGSVEKVYQECLKDYHQIY